jgi:uncharacterized protein with ACT and thioredoxin-like domain
MLVQQLTAADTAAEQRTCRVQEAELARGGAAREAAGGDARGGRVSLRTQPAAGEGEVLSPESRGEGWKAVTVGMV